MGASRSPVKGHSVRTRSLTLLSALAAATLLVAGCSGLVPSGPETPNSTPTPSGTPTGPGEGCLLDVAPGSASDAIVVESTDLASTGAWVSITVPETTAFTEIERTVVSRGNGENVYSGDLVSMKFQIVNADTGETLDSTARDDEGVLPMLLDPQQSSLFVVALECLPLGSEVIFTVPASSMGEGASDIVVWAQAVEFLPTRATGTPVEPVAGMPSVVLDAQGVPTITIPDAPAPTETRVEVLKQGDGAIVQPGDMVVVQYHGVKWDDGEVFDSSWKRGAVTQFPTTGVVTGFRVALEGQRVGSQILVAMPPKDGYAAIAGHALEHETLVFVIDILATNPIQ